jgi:hypothetical protein
MSLQYKIFYVSNNRKGENKMIEEMNDLITTKLNEGWKLVGGVCFAYSDDIGEPFKIYQAMTFETVTQNLLE